MTWDAVCLVDDAQPETGAVYADVEQESDEPSPSLAQIHTIPVQPHTTMFYCNTISEMLYSSPTMTSKKSARTSQGANLTQGFQGNLSFSIKVLRA